MSRFDPWRRRGGDAVPASAVPPSPAVPERLSLALQGGGSFGAFTWGVLDRLLEEPTLRFDIVSGASAGAINAALLAMGLARGGRPGAREQLERFWRRWSAAAPSRSVTAAILAATQVLSPYQLNPLDLSPLRAMLDSEIDFETLRRRRPVRLMVGATRVRDGRLKVFGESEISADVLLASACLPLFHQAVAVDGEDYWDGGYAANPPLLPLVEKSATPDVLLVRIIPTHQDDTPRSQSDIQKRLAHMTFNAPLVRDLDVLASRPAHRPGPVGAPPLRLHTISAEDEVANLAAQSALQLDWAFLRDLRDAGRGAAGRWLASGVQPAASGPRPSPAAQSPSSPDRKVG